MFGLTETELSVLRGLSSPLRIQDYLDSLPINFEKDGETCMSPRRVLREQKAHCLEGALLAATALWVAGEKPLLLDLHTIQTDDDHALALYQRNGYWGAISKTNHASLRFRDPIYKNIRELAASYFHEYFVNETGLKTLRSYSTRPIRLVQFGRKWITAEEDLWHIAESLDDVLHSELFPEENRKYLRKADSMERRAGQIIEWTQRNPRT